MAFNRAWINFVNKLVNKPVVFRNAAIGAGFCTTCSALLYFSCQNHRNQSQHNRLLLMKNVSCETNLKAAKQPTTTVEKVGVAQSAGGAAGDVYQHSREKRFHDFASVEVNGVFMTPQDFLESVTDEDPRPRIGHTALSGTDVKSLLSKTPPQNRNSSRFFRSLHGNGLISYTEYLFLLCILTKPRLGFEIAFNMFDADGNKRVDKKEFLVLEDIFRTRTEKQCYDEQGVVKEKEEKVQDTTLLVHFFGKDGKNDLRYDDFYQFMNNLQTEVLEMEFLTYSRGMSTISEVDFARVLLRFTDVDQIEEHIEKLMQRIPEEKGITFDEFRSFFQFLNDLEDFAIAMHMFTLAGRCIRQDEFKRAVNISTGSELSEHIVNTLFQIFDKDGDNQLSHVEFIGVMKDRIHRGFRRQGIRDKLLGLNGFRRCMATQARAFVRDLSTH